jgi:TraC protein
MKKLYEDLANKAAGLFGFSQTDIESFSAAKESLFASSICGGEPLRNYLAYRYFDNKNEVFLLRESAAGFLLEISPLVGVSDLTVKNLNQFFASELPPSGCLQFFLLASSDIEDFLEFWGSGRTNPDPILQRMTRERKEYLRARAANFHASGKRLPRIFRLFVSYSAIYRSCNEAALAELVKFRTCLMHKLV